MINNFKLLLFLMEHGAFQYLQKSQLQLFRLEGIHVIERTPERVIILIGQTCNQIQMLMDIPAVFDLLHDFRQRRKIHITVDGTNGLGIGGLDTNFKLKQPFPYSFEEIYGFLIDQICCNFKMEIGNTVVMFMEIFPYCHGMTFFTVKSAVDEFHLWYILV